jgi:2-oxoglutarate dehydrogenase E2 component (dihydrolipoamide succinyltransferase)
MIIEIKVPSPGESISEVQLASWLVSDGDFVEKDKEIAEVDSDKATLSLVAQESGVIKLFAAEGDTIKVGALVATIDTTGVGTATTVVTAPVEKVKNEKNISVDTKVVTIPASIDVVPSVSHPVDSVDAGIHITPLARKIMQEKQLTEKDVADHIHLLRVGKADMLEIEKSVKPIENSKLVESRATSFGIRGGGEASREVERKKLSTLRIKLAQRLVSVKNETAMLTTFNEVNMGALLTLKKKYNDAFKEKYGVGIGFMSFFTKAVTEALMLFPQINSMLDGDELVQFHYADIGIAVSAPKGLVVPVVRNAETLSLAEIELKIKGLAKKARENKITLDEMQGGTFTITNGGVFGSLFSTPIINPPQSAILGMHNIVERPIAVNGQVVVASMMYVALSYDHRVIDGSDSVRFLVKVKEMIENPVRLLFEGSEPEKVLLGL